MARGAELAVVTAAWEVTNLIVSHGGRQALNGAGLTASAGEVVGVLGPNGSGKTTLLRAGLGLQRMQVGAASLAGRWLDAIPETEGGYVLIGPTDEPAATKTDDDDPSDKNADGRPF